MAPRGQRFLTFATKTDWTPVLTSMEQILSVKYVESGMLPHQSPALYASFRELPEFCEAVRGDTVQEREYLIMKSDSVIYSRSVRLNTGEMRYVVDHGNNPESVIFRPGGIFKGQEVLVSGELSKLSSLPSTEEIFRALSKLIKKHFMAIKAYRVGCEARSLKNEGYRLTSSIHRPIEYDLSLDDTM
jgi:hypothetical protein